ncbi:hypothetical protein Bhyg_09308 [Pseudolycoriella hygida]|uniref:Uncharacterized protein n=1 Tax=Pseudolycoriella hygida TaxID=35572 RepID=A0A9Q0N670_9DIPT|nr:hypothetical protein Bhyg_09308 [Pseudolycoriella hygida]
MKLCKLAITPAQVTKCSYSMQMKDDDDEIDFATLSDVSVGMNGLADVTKKANNAENSSEQKGHVEKSDEIKRFSFHQL